jgi:sulfur carrier protein
VELTVNGEPRSLPDGATLADLLGAVGAAERGSAAAVDGTVVARSSWPSRVLRSGERVEILQAVQGG